MNSRQITACVVAGLIMIGLLVLLSRHGGPRMDPNDGTLVVPQTVTVGSDQQAEIGASRADVAALSRQAAKEATNLFALPARPHAPDTNMQILHPGASDETLIQPAGEGFLPGPPPGR